MLVGEPVAAGAAPAGYKEKCYKLGAKTDELGNTSQPLPSTNKQLLADALPEKNNEFVYSNDQTKSLSFVPFQTNTFDNFASCRIIITKGSEV